MKRSLSVNAGSMADIAFLLLVFFLICTTINTDAGIPQKLSEPCVTKDCSTKVKERNLLEIKLNANSQIMVHDEIVLQDNLSSYVYEFLANKNKDMMRPEESGDAVIAVTMARETPYEFYVSAMAGIKQAYAKVKNEYSQAVYNKDYEQLSTPQKKKVLEAIPEKITETTD